MDTNIKIKYKQARLSHFGLYVNHVHLYHALKKKRSKK